MDPSTLKHLLRKVESLSREVGDFIAAQRVRPEDIEFKGWNDFVSFVDKQAEEQFVRGLGELLPEAGFIAEEGSGEPKDGLNWIIDPLDGTTNFLHHIPCYCTSIALADGHDIFIGVVYNPVTDEMFTAYKGGGAKLNGLDIRVSSEQRLEASLLATGFPYVIFPGFELYMEVFEKLIRSSRGMRRLGSAAIDLAYVACGRFEAYYEHGLQPWDMAAGILLVREAGGRVSTFDGDDQVLFRRDVLSSNGALHGAIQQEVQPILESA